MDRGTAVVLTALAGGLIALQAPINGRVGEVNTSTDVCRTSLDPQPVTICSGESSSLRAMTP